MAAAALACCSIIIIHSFISHQHPPRSVANDGQRTREEERDEKNCIIGSRDKWKGLARFEVEPRKEHGQPTSLIKVRIID